MYRRSLLLSSLSLPLWRGGAEAQSYMYGGRRTIMPPDCRQYENDWGKVPGDESFGHTPIMHKLFDAVFNDKCPCYGNECRETIIRVSEMGSPFGSDVQINRAWYPITLDVNRPTKDEVRASLEKRGLQDYIELLYVSGKAFVCAYPNPQTANAYCSRMILRCAIVNVSYG